MPKLKRPLYGPADPRGPVKGRDVLMVKRALRRVEVEFFPPPPGGYDEVYNARTAQAIKTFQRIKDLDATGHLGQATLDALWPHFDRYGRWTYNRFKVPPPPPPPLIEPHQGWDSLHRDLWNLYSIGRRMGLGDGPGLASGTFNPDSTLPSGAPSDHAKGPPARAFDLDIGPDTGWANDVARSFFHTCVGDPACAYAILGDRIWSAARADEGIRTYTGGGHENHVHVSGF